MTPQKIGRRRFLALSAAVGALGAGACEPAPTATTTGIPLLSNRVRIPPVLAPPIGPDGVRRFALRLQRGTSTFLPGTSTPTWGINGPYLGPTLRARRGDRVAFDVTNDIGETTTLHWHGMRLPAVMDGGPHQPIHAGETWHPEWRIDQPAATSWYHPHHHGTTAKHVYRGLAGLFLLDDDATDGLGLPQEYGVDDIPLIIQDRKLGADGATAADPSTGEDPVFGLLGDRILVNGTYDAVVPITTTLTRFRILNASTARLYHLAFEDGRPFQLVATDAGLLPRPVQLSRLDLSPGERAEIVVAFAPAERVVLRSTTGEEQIDEGDFTIVTVLTSDQLDSSAPIPPRLAPELRIDTAGAAVRTFTLSGNSRINGHETDMNRIDEVVPAGAREIWEIVNPAYAHNFHIHEVGFRVVSVDGRTPGPSQSGPKDTVFVPSGATVQLAVAFGEYVDPIHPYMYHCHLLRHEDQGMMGQFVVVAPGTASTTLRRLSSHEDTGGSHG